MTNYSPKLCKMMVYIYVCMYVYIYIYIYISIWLFFHEHSRITGLQGKGEGISLTPHCHFHPLHGQLDISRAITAESSPLRKDSGRNRTGNLWFSSGKSLTTKLRALNLPLKLSIYL